VSGEPPFIDPSIDRVLGHPKVGGHIEDANPAFGSHHFNPFVSCQNHCLCIPTKPDKDIRNRSIPVKDRRNGAADLVKDFLGEGFNVAPWANVSEMFPLAGGVFQKNVLFWPQKFPLEKQAAGGRIMSILYVLY